MRPVKLPMQAFGPGKTTPDRFSGAESESVSCDRRLAGRKTTIFDALVLCSLR